MAQAARAGRRGRRRAGRARRRAGGGGTAAAAAASGAAGGGGVGGGREEGGTEAGLAARAPTAGRAGAEAGRLGARRVEHANRPVAAAAAAAVGWATAVVEAAVAAARTASRHRGRSGAWPRGWCSRRRGGGRRQQRADARHRRHAHAARRRHEDVGHAHRAAVGGAAAPVCRIRLPRLAHASRLARAPTSNRAARTLVGARSLGTHAGALGRCRRTACHQRRARDRGGGRHHGGAVAAGGCGGVHRVEVDDGLRGLFGAGRDAGHAGPPATPAAGGWAGSGTLWRAAAARSGRGTAPGRARRSRL